MITKLTTEQERQIPIYREKWLSIGKRTDEVSVSDAYKTALGFSQMLGRKQIPIKLDSPMSCWIGTCILSQIHSQIDSQIYSQTRSQIGSQIGSQIRSQIRSQIDSQIYSQTRSQIGSQIGSQIDSQIDSQIGSDRKSVV